MIKLKSQRNEGEKKIKEGGVLFCGRSRDDVTLTI